MAWRYAVATAAVELALAVRLVLAPVVSDELLYLFFVPAVLAAVSLGGLDRL